MSSSSTHVSGTRGSTLVELGLTLAVLLILAMQAARFDKPQFLRGAGDRYENDQRLAVVLGHLEPPLTVEDLDRRYGGWLKTTTVADCAAVIALGYECPPGELPAEWRIAFNRLNVALARQLEPTRKEIARLSDLAREGLTVDTQGQIDRLLRDTAAYRQFYEIDAAGLTSVPVRCAWEQYSRRYVRFNQPVERVQVLSDLIAVLQGKSEVLTARTSKRESSPSDDATCLALGTHETIARRAAEIVKRARASEGLAQKASRSQQLFSHAARNISVFAVVGLILLNIGRLPVRVSAFVSLAVLLWALAGRWTGVPTPKHVSFDLVALGSAVWLAAEIFVRVRLRKMSAGAAPPTQRMASSLGYPGFVLFVGLGLWLIIDYSANAYFRYRYLALYHQQYVFLAFVVASVVPILRVVGGRGLLKLTGKLSRLAQDHANTPTQFTVWFVMATIGILVLVPSIGVRYFDWKAWTQFNSELLRLWFVGGLSLFLVKSGEQSVTLGGEARTFISRLGKPIFVFVVLVAGLILTDDKGPLLVTVYAGSILIGAFAAFSLGGRRGPSTLLGFFVAALIIVAVTAAIFWIGPMLPGNVAARLDAARHPFSAVTDQMALIQWFRDAAPTWGFGLGNVPWCGDHAGASCRGIPKQLQSDYTFSALWGVFGRWATYGLIAAYSGWLLLIARPHKAVTDGIVGFRFRDASLQAWISWVVILWVALTYTQLLVTIFGNLGWLPLTGITFPFVSFGAWSLWVSALLFGFAVNIIVHNEPDKTRG